MVETNLWLIINNTGNKRLQVCFEKLNKNCDTEMFCIKKNALPDTGIYLFSYTMAQSASQDYSTGACSCSYS